MVVNAAAFTDVDGAEAREAEAYGVNAEGVRNIVRALSGTRCLLVQLSTDYVFSGDKTGPYVETDDESPLSVYGKSKLEGEAAAAKHREHLIVRTSGVFGQGKNFVASVLKAGAERSFIEVVDDQIGRPTYAPDLAQGIYSLVASGARGLIHLTGEGPPASRAEVAEWVIESAGLPMSVERISTAELTSKARGPLARRPMNGVLDCAKAKVAGVELSPWREGVKEYVRSLPGFSR